MVARGWRTVAVMAASAWLLVLTAAPCRAMHQRLYPLAEVIRDAQCIATARVAAIDPARMRVALRVETPLKGEAPARWMAVNLAPGGWGHPPAMLRRLAPDLPVLLFAARVRSRYVLLGYTEGTWFQFTAPIATASPEALDCTFNHIEVHLRRTYRGPTAELRALAMEVVQGKRSAPPPNPDAGSGMGPEVTAVPFPSGIASLPGPVRTLLERPRADGRERPDTGRTLSAADSAWVREMATRFQRTQTEVEALLVQSAYQPDDARRALELEQQHGRGGDRAWVRMAEEILELKQRNSRLTWVDLRGILQRAGEIFTPLTDPVQMIHGLRARFSWDELDPWLDDEKWGRRKLADAVAARDAERLTGSLLPGERQVMLSTAVDPPPAPMEDEVEEPRFGPGWGALGARPPRIGIPLGEDGLTYAGGARRLEGAPGQGNPPPHARAEFPQLAMELSGDRRTLLAEACLFAPDHTDAVGATRPGWLYIGRPSRAVYVGFLVKGPRVLRLTAPVEPHPERFETIQWRVDLIPMNGNAQQLRLTAFAGGIEVARTGMELPPDATRVTLVPCVSLGNVRSGSTPEVYLTRARVWKVLPAEPESP